jgi:Flp pilus assembly protein TadG
MTPRSKRPFGQALVEFALVLVLFLVIVLGILDWGFYLYSTIIMDTAVRDAVRFAVTYTDWTTNVDARTADVRNIVSDRAQFLPVSVRTGLAGRTFVTFSPDINNLQAITVEVRNQPFRSLSGFMNVVIPAAISTRATMRYERR